PGLLLQGVYSPAEMGRPRDEQRALRPQVTPDGRYLWFDWHSRSNLASLADEVHDIWVSDARQPGPPRHVGERFGARVVISGAEPLVVCPRKRGLTLHEGRGTAIREVLLDLL